MKRLLLQFARRDAHPAVQFVKYGICGVLATAVDVLVFYFLAWKIIPALQEDDIFVKVLGIGVTPVDEAIRPIRYVIDKSIAFVLSNLTAYVTNVLWVFEPGRHERHKEIAYFYAVSLVSFAVGTLLGWSLIKAFALSTTAAFLANGVASVLINYAGRKFFIFKK